mgnify:CR=1 FL=1
MPSSNEELQIKLIYLELLQRQPTSDEIALHEAELSSTTITLLDIENYVKSQTEYKILIGSYHGELEYNPSGSSSSSSTSTVFDIFLENYPTSQGYSENYDGVLLANGKLGVVTSSRPNMFDASYVTTSFDFDHVGQYTKNTLDGFNYLNFDLFNLDLHHTANSLTSSTSTVIYENVTQKLDMYQATFTNDFDCRVEGGDSIHVTTKTAVLRQYPYCVIQKISFVNSDSTSSIEVPFYHKLLSDEKYIHNVRYNNNVINKTATSNYHFFSGLGDFVTEHNERFKICVNNCYLVDAVDPSSSVAYKGYNMDKNNNNLAYNQLTITIPAGQTVHLSILSSMMTEQDFKNPELETTRILVNLLNKTSNEILVEHNLEWSKMWDSRIVIEERTDLDASYAEELEKINTIKRITYYSLYNIYSVTRDDVNVEVNPLNLSTLDADGSIFWNSELWVMPVLIFLKPKIARTLLNFRYQQLERAKKLAIAHGFKGAKFPYENDLSNYNDVYWSSISPLHIFNTALISVNTWNYFRVTRDIDWLRTMGYKILKNNADFFQSKSEYDSLKGKYVIKNVIAYNNIHGDNNILTNYLCKLALQYAMEASYELNYIPDSRWGDALNMYLPITSQPTTDDVPNKTPTSTNIFVRLEKIDSLETYVFYNGTSETDAIETNRIGWKFGKYSGISMVLTSATTYLFHLSTNISTKPISFCDTVGNLILPQSRSNAIEVLDGGKRGYHSGVYAVSSSTLASYKYYEGEYLNTYGFSAFTTDATKVHITNILRLHETYNGEDINILEQFIIMYPYYSRHFFTLPSVDVPYNNKTIKDNLIYYSDRLTTEGETFTFNKLLESGLYATLAQDELSYAFRKIYINTYYEKNLKAIDQNTTKPWNNWRRNMDTKQVKNNISFSALHLLTLLTTMGGLRVTGSINESRYYTEEYGIKQRSSFVMPETWKTMKIKGIGGVKNAEFTVRNTNFLSTTDENHHLCHCPCP